MAGFELNLHILADLVHGHVSRAFDNGLHVVLPSDLGKFAQCLQLSYLRSIVGIVDAARAQAIAEGYGYVVVCEDPADLFEMLVDETFALVGGAPVGDDGTTAGDDPRETAQGQRHVVPTQTGVDGEVVHTLLSLLDERIAEYLPVELRHITLHLLQRLVERYGADGHG